MRGFTVTELLVVVAIIVLLTALTLPNWREGQETLALERSAFKLAQDARKAQELSLRAQAFTDCPSGFFVTGYGVVFDGSAPSEYRLFANCKEEGGVDNLAFDGSDRVLETLELETGIELSDPPQGAERSMVIIPPTPLIFFRPGGGSSMTVELSTNDGRTKRVLLTDRGIIEVQ